MAEDNVEIKLETNEQTIVGDYPVPLYAPGADAHLKGSNNHVVSTRYTEYLMTYEDNFAPMENPANAQRLQEGFYDFRTPPAGEWTLVESMSYDVDRKNDGTEEEEELFRRERYTTGDLTVENDYRRDGTPKHLTLKGKDGKVNIEARFNTDGKMKLYENKEAEFPEPEAIREIERVILLKVIDRKWMDHIDDMDQLRQGVGL